MNYDISYIPQMHTYVILLLLPFQRFQRYLDSIINDTLGEHTE